MTVISNERLRQVAYQIMGEPGFSIDGQGLLRAHERWVELTEPAERLAIERALFARWLENLRAERTYPDIRIPLPPARDDRPKVVRAQAGNDDPESAPKRPAPVSEIRFRSESPDWRHADDFPGAQVLNAAQRETGAGEQAPVPASEAAPPRGPSPVRDQVQHRVPEPVTVTNIASQSLTRTPVQQPSRKVASYRQMFPELAFPVQTVSGAKPLAEFGAEDIDYRIGALREQRQAWRTENAGDEARVEDRERLNARDRVRIAERGQNIRDAQDEETRLTTAKGELAESGCAAIGELSLEALAACGFKRRVA